MDDFKKATAVDYTAFDLNCRHIVPHTKQRNKAEKMIKRKARRKLKENLKKVLTTTIKCGIIITERNERGNEL